MLANGPRSATLLGDVPTRGEGVAPNTTVVLFPAIVRGVARWLGPAVSQPVRGVLDATSARRFGARTHGEFLVQKPLHDSHGAFSFHRAFSPCIFLLHGHFN